MIIRTSWLYSEYGKNFVKTILEKGKSSGRLSVVYDQVGGPTYAGDLAAAILQILSGAFGTDTPEIYHYANEGAISWYDFAKAITEIAGIECTILPIESKDFPVPAVRPCYSVFNKTRFITRFGIRIPYWRESLEHCIHNILEEKQVSR
jgi:dTDP-4-dehydrorhamnose reductase